MDLSGKRIAILIAPGYHEHEFLYPYYRLKEAKRSATIRAHSQLEGSDESTFEPDESHHNSKDKPNNTNGSDTPMGPEIIDEPAFVYRVIQPP